MEEDLRKIFVSHSAKDPFARNVQRRVCALLRDKHYEVFLDVEVLEPGVDWSARLNHWLGLCHGAVLLLSRDALVSPWVRQEATILLHRRANGSPVHIVPALVGDVRPADVEAHGFADLAPLQFAMLDASADTDADAAELAQKIAKQFANLRPPTFKRDRVREWIDRVTHFLGHVGDEDRLGACARALGVPDNELGEVTLPEGRRFLAHQFLGNVVGRQAYDAVSTIADYMHREWLDKLVADLRFVWVNSDAARKLLTASQQPHAVVTLLNARSPLTVDEYLDRATCRGGYWREVAGTVVGEDAVGELVTHYEKAVANLLGVEPEWTVEDYEPGEEPCFLVVNPADVPLDAVTAAIREVQRRHPWLVVILLTGEEPPESTTVSGWRLRNARLLTPALAPGEELAARRVVRELRRLLTR